MARKRKLRGVPKTLWICRYWAETGNSVPETCERKLRLADCRSCRPLQPCPGPAKYVLDVWKAE